MSQINISDYNGHLTLRGYNDNTTTPSLALRDREVRDYVMKLLKYPIRDVQFTYRDGEIYDILMNYDSFNIKLSDCKKLEQHERHLKPLTDAAVSVVERQNLERIKRSRQEKGNRAFPRVQRENKHAGVKLISGAVAFVMLTIGVSAGVKAFAGENIEKPNYSMDVEGEVPSLDASVLDDVDFNPISVDYKDSNVASQMDSLQKYNLELEYVDNSETDKALLAKELYGDTIEKYAKSYGLDPNLVLAIATQERGIHSPNMDSGGATGLMQVQNSVWVNKEISAHNFETGEDETFTVRKEMLSDVDTNIKLGCMILQNAMEDMDYNIVAAVQCYNMGYGNMNKILNAYASDQGLTKEEVLQNHNDYGWLGYRDIITVGDPEYVEHVFSWLGNSAELSVMSTDSSVTNLSVRNPVTDVKSY